MRVLVSGASIAGPVLAYWLARYGFTVTVVEKASTLRKAGGHAVDLFKPSMTISEQMGVLPRILKAATGTEQLIVHTRRRSVRMNVTKLVSAASDRHVEIMRDDLSEIYYDATEDDVEYLFGNAITEISEDGRVGFENGPAREFDLVIGADGLRSNVRRLIFGEVPEHYLGGYFAVISAPRELAEANKFVSYLDAGRWIGIYTAAHLPDARLTFLFRTDQPLDYDHRDLARQKELLRKAFAGFAPQVDRWLTELDHTPTFYFDSITQLRVDSWSRGRVTLVGDAAYCPGPVVGGSTSLAVLGAYTLAGELAAADGDHTIAFPAYEAAMADAVRGSRAFALRAAKTLVPASATGVWALTQSIRLFNILPAGLSRAVAELNTTGVRMLDSMTVPDYSTRIPADE
ncbi:FAD-dependent monooxygenase [Nocardia transvalensis]|uniref:FAD-dependent monooxygenase n=1 Tax=Nocardia transvalensis TaxID=37333 RepID=UPI001896001F|nr:FAD-dependent monooxygenase [Nocardia transvalensis]MBF6329942.1 FAD-dependent monooxygenase [Nocardia transvalensis]